MAKSYVPPIVLDCSLVMAWCFEDEFNKYSQDVLELLDVRQALVPSLFPIEVANVLLMAERKQRISPIESAEFVTTLFSLPIKIEENTLNYVTSSTLQLAREAKLTVYDACYLELAIREKAELATLDKDLKKAAKRYQVEYLTTSAKHSVKI